MKLFEIEGPRGFYMQVSADRLKIEGNRVIAWKDDKRFIVCEMVLEEGEGIGWRLIYDSDTV